MRMLYKNYIFVMFFVVGAFLLFSCEAAGTGSPVAELGEFKITAGTANVEGIIDHDAGTITLNLPSGSTVADLDVSSVAAKAVHDKAELQGIGKAADFTSGEPVYYVVKSEDGRTTRRYKIVIKRGDAEIIDFGISGVKASPVAPAAEGEPYTITIGVPESTDLSSIVPEFTLSEGATLRYAGNRKYTSGDKIDFTNPVIFTAYSESGSVIKTYRITVNFEVIIETFTFTNSLRIDINQQDGTIDVYVRNSEDVSAVTPGITQSSGATIDKAGPQNFDTPVVYTVTGSDSALTKSYTVTVTKLNIANDITSFDFPDALNVRISANTVEVDVAKTTALANVEPTITVSSEADYEPKGAQDFSGSAVIYTVTSQAGAYSEDAADKKAYTVSINTLSDAKSIVGVTNNDILAADIAPDAVTLSVRDTLNIASLDPQFTISASASISPTVPQDFSAGKTVQYTVTAADTTTKVYTVSVRSLGTDTSIQSFDFPGAHNERIIGSTVEVDVANTLSLTSVAPTITLGDSNADYEPKGAQDFSGSAVTYTVTSEAGLISGTAADQQAYTVNINTLSDAKDITDATNTDILRVGGLSTNAVTLSVRDTLNIASLDPQFTVSAGASYTPTGAQDFSGGKTVTYTVTAADSTTKSYTVSVRSLGTDTSIQSFDFPGALNVRITGSGTVEVDVASTLSLTAVAPTITLGDSNADYEPKGAQDFSGSTVTYTVTSEAGLVSNAAADQQAYGVNINIRSGAKDITDAANGDILETIITTNAVTLSVRDTLNIASLDPQFTMSASASIFPTGPQDFSAGKTVTYTVTAADTTTKVYTVSVRSLGTDTSIQSFDFPGALDVRITGSTVEVDVASTLPLTSVAPTITLGDSNADYEPKGAQNFSGSAVTYTVTSEAGLISGAAADQQAYTVNIVTLSSDAQIQSITYGTYNAVMDHSANTATISVPIGTDVRAINRNDFSVVLNHAGASGDWSSANQDLNFHDSTADEYVVTAEDQTTKTYTVIFDVPLSIISFKILSEDGIIDHAQETISVSVAAGTPVDNITPVVVASRASVTVTPSGAQDFSSPVTYTVDNAGSQKSYTVTVTHRP